MLNAFFTPLHLLSFYKQLSKRSNVFLLRPWGSAGEGKWRKFLPAQAKDRVKLTNIVFLVKGKIKKKACPQTCQSSKKPLKNRRVINFFFPGQGNGKGPSWRFLALDRAQHERVRQEGSTGCSLINVSRFSLEERNLCATKSFSPSWPVQGRAEPPWALAETGRFLLPIPPAPGYIIKKRSTAE